MALDFNEISDHKQFENLVVSYFEDLKKEKSNNIIDVVVKPSGTGVDGGRDILVTFKVTDSIMTFDRTWVIQCKFHKSDISTNKISDINIPTLIHSYKASGYLLVCRQNPTSKLTQLFEQLSINCILGYNYVVWSGEQFKHQLIVKNEILQQYFPKYFEDYNKFLNK